MRVKAHAGLSQTPAPVTRQFQFLEINFKAAHNIRGGYGK